MVYSVRGTRGNITGQSLTSSAAIEPTSSPAHESAQPPSQARDAYEVGPQVGERPKSALAPLSPLRAVAPAAVDEMRRAYDEAKAAASQGREEANARLNEAAEAKKRFGADSHEFASAKKAYANAKINCAKAFELSDAAEQAFAKLKGYEKDVMRHNINKRLNEVFAALERDAGLTEDDVLGTIAVAQGYTEGFELASQALRTENPWSHELDEFEDEAALDSEIDAVVGTTKQKSENDIDDDINAAMRELETL